MGLIIDTGPLVAALRARDEHHAWAVRALSMVRPPLATCDAVVSEACFLLERAGCNDSSALLSLVLDGLIIPTFRFADEVRAVDALMRRYASVPMSFADACLVRMAELDRDPTGVTLDEDFRVYRRNGRGPIRVIAPWSA